MPLYVLQRTDGVYVAPSGSAHSYTKHLEKAQTFRTLESAMHARLENERVVSVESLLQSPV